MRPDVRPNAGPAPSVTQVVKLSVVVPFYNVQTYALETLRSLRANSREDFEFVLVDDCSTDGTPEILERAKRELPGAVLLRHEKNGGLATARNTGLDASRGEYVTYLDGDDWVAPGFYERLLGSIEGLGCDFVRTDHVQFTARARTVRRVPVGRRDEVLRPRDWILPEHRSTSVDYPYAWAGIYHRRLADRGLLHFTDGLRTAEDRPWIWRLHREAATFAVVSLAGVFYRRMVSGSLTRVGDERQLHFFDAFELVFKDLEEEFLPKAVRNFCALLAHHLEIADRFTPQLRARFEERGAAMVRTLPTDLVTEAAGRMSMEREATLRALLPDLPASPHARFRREREDS